MGSVIGRLPQVPVGEIDRSGSDAQIASIRSLGAKVRRGRLFSEVKSSARSRGKGAAFVVKSLVSPHWVHRAPPERKPSRILMLTVSSRTSAGSLSRSPRLCTRRSKAPAICRTGRSKSSNASSLGFRLWPIVVRDLTRRPEVPPSARPHADKSSRSLSKSGSDLLARRRAYSITRTIRWVFRSTMTRSLLTIV